MGAACCTQEAHSLNFQSSRVLSIPSSETNEEDIVRLQEGKSKVNEVGRLESILLEIEARKMLSPEFLHTLYTRNGSPRKASSWKIVHETRYPVYASKAAQLQDVVCMKQPGDIVRGYQDDAWLVLVDEIGYIRMVALSTGTSVVEKVGGSAPDGGSSTRLPSEIHSTADEPDSPQTVVTCASASSRLCGTRTSHLRSPVATEHIPSVIIVALQPTDAVDKLGIDVESAISHRIRGLRITSLRNGLISEWNRTHSDQKVQIGDLIVEVNGVQGDTNEMYEKSMEDLLIQRCLIMSVLQTSSGKSNASDVGLQPIEVVNMPLVHRSMHDNVTSSGAMSQQPHASHDTEVQPSEDGSSLKERMTPPTDFFSKFAKSNWTKRVSC